VYATQTSLKTPLNRFDRHPPSSHCRRRRPVVDLDFVLCSLLAELGHPLLCQCIVSSGKTERPSRFTKRLIAMLLFRHLQKESLLLSQERCLNVSEQQAVRKINFNYNAVILALPKIEKMFLFNKAKLKLMNGNTISGRSKSSQM
jgi:hypothetical protein